MNSLNLKRIAYVSHQVHDFTDEDVLELMIAARQKNANLEITGLLLFHKPVFLQLLEGPPAAIDKLIAEIIADERHKDVAIIFSRDNCPEREFPGWSMDYKILGHNKGEKHSELDARVKQVLDAANPNGELAHQLLLDFREAENTCIDI